MLDTLTAERSFRGSCVLEGDQSRGLGGGELVVDFVV